MSARRTSILAVLLLSTESVVAWGQEPVVDCLSFDKVNDGISSRLEVLSAQVDDVANEIRADEPLSSPSAAGVLGSSAAGGSLSIADAAGLLRLFGLAYEGGIVDASGGRITLTLSPFAVRAGADPSQIWEQSKYISAGNTLMRRVNLSFGSGGTGEATDRDGDGEIDDGLEAKDLGDIVSAELRLRLWGSRDRREPRNFAAITRAVRERIAPEILLERIDQIRLEIEQSEANQSALGASKEAGLELPGDCVSPAAFAEWMASSSRAVEAARSDFAANAEARRQAVAAVDASPELSFFAQVLERKRDFGSDSLRAGFRYVSGGLTANLDWSRVDLVDSEVDPQVARFALDYSALWWRGSAPFEEGVRASAEGSYQYHRNVPDARFDTTAKFGVSLELPLGSGLAFPIGITWANHRALLDENDELRGHLGLKFDLESLVRKAVQGGSG